MVAKFLVILAFAFIVPAVSTHMCTFNKNRSVPLDCPPNEEYCECAPVVCDKTCADLVHRPPCPLVRPDCYLPACVCIDGYLRNENGTCVPSHECPNPLDENVYFLYDY